MRTIRMPFLMTVATGMFVLAACSHIDNGSDGDAGTDSDSDADTNTDADAGSDTDSDTDPLDCDGGRYDESTGLCWQHPRTIDDYAWQAAIDYCDGLDFGGHTDWVLPTRQDFVDLFGGCDDNVLDGYNGWCNPCPESETCSALFGADTDWYWSSSSSSITDNAWYVNFVSGIVNPGPKELLNFVRCVRAGP